MKDWMNCLTGLKNIRNSQPIADAIDKNLELLAELESEEDEDGQV